MQRIHNTGGEYEAVPAHTERERERKRDNTPHHSGFQQSVSIMSPPPPLSECCHSGPLKKDCT